MQEILTAFGIDARIIVIQIVNFGLLVAVLWYFLYKPVLKILSDREEKIKKGVLDAQKAEEALSQADQEKSEILKVAHGEAAQIVSRGTAHAEEKGKAILLETAEKAARELENAKATAEELKAQALKESEAEIAKLAMLGAEKILKAELSK